MTREELKTLMDGTGIYYDPDHPDHIERSKIESLPPPFMEFSAEEVPFAADDVIYYTSLRITIRFYSDLDVDSEEDSIRSALTGYFFTTNKVYDNELGLWETDFTFTTKKE